MMRSIMLFSRRRGSLVPARFIVRNRSHAGFRTCILSRISQKLLAAGIGTEAVGLALMVLLEGNVCRLEGHAAHWIAGIAYRPRAIMLAGAVSHGLHLGCGGVRVCVGPDPAF